MPISLAFVHGLMSVMYMQNLPCALLSFIQPVMNMHSIAPGWKRIDQHFEIARGSETHTGRDSDVCGVSHRQSRRYAAAGPPQNMSVKAVARCWSLLQQRASNMSVSSSFTWVSPHPLLPEEPFQHKSPSKCPQKIPSVSVKAVSSISNQVMYADCFRAHN